MISNNPMQLKAFVKKVAEEKKVSAQLVMQNYMLERLLERISLSAYKDRFIIKGGLLISAMVGLSTRATLDLDTTIQGITLTESTLKRMFEEIVTITLDDQVVFALLNVAEIREKDEYPGFRLSLKANYNPISVPLSVDVTTGDKITPHEIDYRYPLLFEKRTIAIKAYNLETILAEKCETILSRSIANTRLRDYYDVSILLSLRGSEVDYRMLYEAFYNTTKKRHTDWILEKYRTILIDIRQSKRLHELCETFSNKYDYAKDISFDQVCDAIEKMMNRITR